MNRVADLESRFAHVYQPSINPKSPACHACGLPGSDAIHVPARPLSWFERAILDGYTPQSKDHIVQPD